MSAQGSPVSAQAAVPSPCINVCRMHAASGLCEGCQRTLAEIGAWASMGEAEKREVWRQLEQRREACMPSRLETRKDCP
jgi:predicted Fe-S protein YdhL (DUF1289 family)